ncbi:hypothetical protein ARSEF4850_004237 [Beauveria asiatica]
MKLPVISAVFVSLATAAAATPTREVAAAAAAAAAVPDPVQDGIAKNCKSYYQAKPGDSCQKIVNDYGVFTFGDFYKWNPAVGNNCESLLGGWYYCVDPRRVARPAAARATTTTTTTGGPPPASLINYWHYTGPATRENNVIMRGAALPDRRRFTPTTMPAN